MAGRARRSQPAAGSFVEAMALCGVAVGVVAAASNAAHSRVASHPCPTPSSGISHCFGQTLTRDLTPYVTGAITGLLIGCAVAVALLLTWRATRAKLAAGGLRQRAATTAAVQPAVLRSPITPQRAASSPRPRREPIAERVRHEVWRRDQGRCVDCGGRERLEFDHIIPVSRGGSNTVRNIELRCERCNGRKGARI